MTRNNDHHSDDEDDPAPGLDAQSSSKSQRREPSFGAFDDDDENEYEEPDRDTDYASGYIADDVEEEGEEDFDDTDPEEEEDDQFPAEDSGLRYESSGSFGAEPDAWLDEEGYLDKEERSGHKWPLSLMAVASVALVLLAAGGYGVMQQRADTQKELRELRAALGTTASPEDVTAARAALQDMQQSYDKLSAIAEAMKLENRRLVDTVAGLEAQLGVQQAVLTKTVPAVTPIKRAAPVKSTSPRPVAAASTAPKPIAPQPVVAAPRAAAAPLPAAPLPAASLPAASKPAAAPTAAATSSGPWFVNFGSYAARSAAEAWSGKLRPRAGKVIVAPNTRDGQTLYRVRVIGLPSRSSAQEVARQLEVQWRVSELWVGKE